MKCINKFPKNEMRNWRGNRYWSAFGSTDRKVTCSTHLLIWESSWNYWCESRWDNITCSFNWDSASETDETDV